MRRYVCLMFLCIFLTAPYAFAGPLEEGWKNAKQGEGITVYTKPVPGSDFKEFMGITDVDAPMEVLLALFKDIPSFPQWFGFCRDIRVEKDISDAHKLVYFILATPWPVKDRDMIIDVKFDVHQGQGRAVITMNALKDELVPVQSKYVRMTHLIGKCTLTRIDADTTHVVYMVDSDPGGNIPVSVNNMLAKDQPFLTLKGMKEMGKKDVYYEKAGMKKK